MPLFLKNFGFSKKTIIVLSFFLVLIISFYFIISPNGFIGAAWYCQNGNCIGESEPGLDECQWDWDCKHTECDNGVCNTIFTPGASQCMDADFPQSAGLPDCKSFQCGGSPNYVCHETNDPGPDGCDPGAALCAPGWCSNPYNCCADGDCQTDGYCSGTTYQGCLPYCETSTHVCGCGGNSGSGINCADPEENPGATCDQVGLVCNTQQQCTCKPRTPEMGACVSPSPSACPCGSAGYMSCTSGGGQEWDSVSLKCGVCFETGCGIEDRISTLVKCPTSHQVIDQGCINNLDCVWDVNQTGKCAAQGICEGAIIKITCTSCNSGGGNPTGDSECNSDRQCEANGGGASCATAENCAALPMKCNTETKQCVPGGDGSSCTGDIDCVPTLSRCDANKQCSPTGDGLRYAGYKMRHYNSQMPDWRRRKCLY